MTGLIVCITLIVFIIFICLLIVVWFYHAAEKLNRGLQPMDQFLRLDQQIHPGVAPRRWSSKPSEVVWWPQPRRLTCCNDFLADHVQSSGTPSKYLRLSRKPHQKWVVMQVESIEYSSTWDASIPSLQLTFPTFTRDLPAFRQSNIRFQPHPAARMLLQHRWQCQSDHALTGKQIKKFAEVQ